MKTSVNVERINQVADAIEASHYATDNKGFGYNQGAWFYRSVIRGGNHCGTTACIAGWARITDKKNIPLGQLLKEGAGEIGFDWISYGMKEFNLGLEPAKALFRGSPYLNFEIHPLHAVETLRHLAETGYVNWDEGYRRFQARMQTEQQRKKEWQEALTFSAEIPLEIEVTKEKTNAKR